MFSVAIEDILLTMSASFFLLGMISFGLGVTILYSRATGQDFRSVARQTAQLAQKGITEELAGLVGNANALLNTMAEMVRTAAGVGVFLTLSGTILMGGGVMVIMQLK